jgi:hypothetical protein
MPLPTGFSKQLADLPDSQLSKMLSRPEDYLPEALEAARAELLRRNVSADTIAELDGHAEARRIAKENKAKEHEKEREKRKLFAKIESREEALKNIKAAARFFWIVAGIQAVAAFFLDPLGLPEAGIVAVLAGVLFWQSSRVAAILLMLISTTWTIGTCLNLLGISNAGGRNIFLAIVAFMLSLRAVQVTFKFHQFR